MDGPMEKQFQKNMINLKNNIKIFEKEQKLAGMKRHWQLIYMISKLLKISSIQILHLNIWELLLINSLWKAFTWDHHLSILLWVNTLTLSYKLNIGLRNSIQLPTLNMDMWVFSFLLKNMTELSQMPKIIQSKISSTILISEIFLNQLSTKLIMANWWKLLIMKIDGCIKDQKHSHLVSNMFIGTLSSVFSLLESMNLQDSQNSWKAEKINLAEWHIIIEQSNQSMITE